MGNGWVTLQPCRHVQLNLYLKTFFLDKKELECKSSWPKMHSGRYFYPLSTCVPSPLRLISCRTHRLIIITNDMIHEILWYDSLVKVDGGRRSPVPKKLAICKGQMIKPISSFQVVPSLKLTASSPLKNRPLNAPKGKDHLNQPSIFRGQPSNI